LALVPEDRKQQGLFLAMAVRENLSMASLDLHSRGGFLRRASERRAAQVLVATLGIATADIEQSVAHLSGGNHRKWCWPAGWRFGLECCCWTSRHAASMLAPARKSIG
jgi:ribose transport system ATP-binding protein